MKGHRADKGGVASARPTIADDLDTLIDNFCFATKVLRECEWDGVQVHARGRSSHPSSCETDRPQLCGMVCAFQYISMARSSISLAFFSSTRTMPELSAWATVPGRLSKMLRPSIILVGVLYWDQISQNTSKPRTPGLALALLASFINCTQQ